LALRGAALVLSMTAAVAAASDTELRPWQGKDTPALALDDLSGRRVDLRDMRGRVVLVNFWATWCEPCRDEMPSIQRLRDRLKGRPFEVLLVNFGEGAARIGPFLTKLGISMPVLLDPEKDAAAAWKAGGLPMTFLVDANGKVRYSALGDADWNAGEFARAVEKLVAEVPRARR
jgi:thiol-disulfide isomerase/thioredoxin